MVLPLAFSYCATMLRKPASCLLPLHIAGYVSVDRDGKKDRLLSGHHPLVISGDFGTSPTKKGQPIPDRRFDISRREGYMKSAAWPRSAEPA